MPSKQTATAESSIEGRRLMRHNKQALKEMAAGFGIELRDSATKAELVISLLGAGKKGKKENEEGSDIYWK